MSGVIIFLIIHLNFANNGSSHRWYSIEKGVLKNFTKFTGKHLHHNLFFNKEKQPYGGVLIKRYSENMLQI